MAQRHDTRTYHAPPVATVLPAAPPATPPPDQLRAWLVEARRGLRLTARALDKLEAAYGLAGDDPAEGAGLER